MSGQFPPPSASPPVPYTAHHLPPAAPTPGQYPPAPQQRLRVPNLGSSPPPAQGHIPPWGHSTQNAALNSIPSNLGYFGPPHIGALGGPGRGQQWQTGPKPSTHPVERNPLFSLQMLVSQEASSAGGTAPGIRPNDDYQQETMDLSSHSGSTTIDDHLPVVRKDNLRNGGIVSNGEICNTLDERKSPAKPPDSVSVIAQNPLRDAQEPVIGTVLNCSSKPEPKPLDVAMECSSVVKNLPESSPVIEKSVVPSGTTVELKPNITSTSAIVEKPVASSITIEKLVIPQSNVNTVRSVSSSPNISVEKSIVPLSGIAVEKVDKPPVPSFLPSKVTDDWEGSNHTPDNVESILENMFLTEEEKSNSSGALPLVVPQSVIVTNDSRSSLQGDSVLKSSILEAKPASPEKINEQKLAEILKVEEPDVEMDGESKPFNTSDSKSDKTNSDFVVKNEKQVPPKRNEKDNIVKEESSIASVKEETKSFGDAMSIESASSEDVKPVVSESEEKTSQSSELSQQSSPLPASSKQLVGTTPDLPTSSSAPVETEGIESAKNAFIEVESELEKMFAGIVEPGSEMSASVEMDLPSSSMAQQSCSNSGVRKNLTLQEKKRGRPKGTPARRNSDSVFSSDSSSKKKQKRPSDSDKKTKKSKLDLGRDSPVLKKAKGSYVKDASNDSGSTAGVKSRGPLIHIEGSREIPTSVIIVNSGVRTSEEDENTEKIAKPLFRKKTTYQEGRTSKIVGSGLYNSTLSSRYDSHTPDATWICVFCKRGPHCDGGLGGEPAGDLFGPYVISVGPGDSSTSPRGIPSDKELVEEQKRRGGGKQASLRATGGAEQFIQKIGKKHKRSISTDSESGLAGLVPVAGEKNEYEVWMHEQCAVWAPGMYLIGSNLVGLQEAVWASVKMACSKCGEPGASISCVTRGCPLVLHYGCAAREGWQLDTETFIAKCKNHIRGAGFFPSSSFMRHS